MVSDLVVGFVPNVSAARGGSRCNSRGSTERSLTPSRYLSSISPEEAANSNISLVSLLELSLLGVKIIPITLPSPLPNYPLFLSTRRIRSGLS